MLSINLNSFAVLDTGTASGVSARPTPSSATSPLANLKAKYLETLIRHFFVHLEGALPLLLESGGSSYSMLKASLLHGVASIRTVGGEASARPLDQVMAAFDRDVEAWQKVLNSNILERAKGVFTRLSAEIKKAKEEGELSVKASESKLIQIKADAERLKRDIAAQQQAVAMAESEITAAQELIAEAKAAIARAEPIRDAGKAKVEELTGQSLSLVQAECEETIALAEAKARLDKSLTVGNDSLRTQAITIAEEERREELSVLEARLRSHVTR